MKTLGWMAGIILIIGVLGTGGLAAAQDCVDYSGIAPLDPPLLWSVPGYSAPSSVASVGDWAYAVDREGIKILDLRDENDVKIHGHILEPRRLYAIRSIGDRIFVTASGGVRVWDVSDPGSPTPLPSLEAPWSLSDLTVEGPLLYGIDGNEIVRIDASQTPPVEAGRWTCLYGAQAMAVSDSIAWISYMDDVCAYDLREGGAGAEIPTGLETYNTQYGHSLNFIKGRMLVVHYSSMGSDWTDIYDVSNPGEPLLVGWVNGDTRPHVIDDLMFIDTDVYDITSIDDPIDVGDVPHHYARCGSRSLVGISNGFGLESVDIMDPGFPIIDSKPPLVSSDIMIREYPGLLRSRTGLWTLEATGPPSPVPTDLPNGSLSCTRHDETIDGTRFYMASYDSIFIHDLTTPHSCPRIGSFSLYDLFFDNPRLVGFGVHAGIAYMGVQQGQLAQSKLYTIDVSNPSTPIILDELTLPNFFSVRGTQVVGHTLYLATQLMGLRKIDITNPADMVYLEQDSGAAECVDLRLFGDTLAMIMDPGGTWLYDVSDPSLPLERHILDADGHSHDTVVYGDRAYMVDRPDTRCDPSYAPPPGDRIKIFDLSGTTPLLLGRVAVPGRPASIFATNDQLVIATYNGGWYGLPLDCGTVAIEPPPPADPGAVPTSLRLLPAVPNPFNPRTTISWDQASPGPVTVDVYDLAGRHIASLVDGQRRVGRHAVTWDGRNSAGRAQAAGTYMISVRHVDERKVRKVVLVR